MARRNRGVLAIGLLAGFACGALLEAVEKPLYRAEARLELSGSAVGKTPVELAFLADSALRGAVLGHAARGLEAAGVLPSKSLLQSSLAWTLGLAAVTQADAGDDLSPAAAWLSELRGGLDVSPNSEAGTIAIRFDDTRPERASQIANALAAALIAYRAADGEKRRLETVRLRLAADHESLLPAFSPDHADMRALRIQIADLDRQIVGLEQGHVSGTGFGVEEAPGAMSFRLVDRASAAATRRIENGPSSILPSVLITLSLAGIGIARRELAVPAAATADEITLTFGLPVVETGTDLLPALGPAPLLFLTGPDSRRTASIAREAAARIAAAGHRTLLVDGDIAAPKLHAAFGVTNTRGLTSLIAGSVTRAGYPHLFARVGTSLWLLPAGSIADDPRTHRRQEGIVSLLGRSFDRVVVAAPLAEAATDGPDWKKTATTILVLSPTEGWRERGSRALGRLAQDGSRVVAIAIASEATDRPATPRPRERSARVQPSPTESAYDWRPRSTLRGRLAKGAAARLAGLVRRGRQS